jgi:hypothetical protein
MFLTDRLMDTVLDLRAHAGDDCLTDESKTGTSNAMILMLESCATGRLLETRKDLIRCARQHRKVRRPTQQQVGRLQETEWRQERPILERSVGRAIRTGHREARLFFGSNAARQTVSRHRAIKVPAEAPARPQHPAVTPLGTWRPSSPHQLPVAAPTQLDESPSGQRLSIREMK